MVRPGTPAGIDGYLRETLGRELWLGVYLGPPRAVQKPVLQLISPGSGTFAFAKLGVTPYTRDLVRTEVAVLARLRDVSWQHLRIPAVLHHGHWHSHEVLVLQALRRRRTGSDSSPPELITQAAVELARCRGTRSTPVLNSDYWQSLRSRIESLTGGPSPAAATLGHAVEHLQEHLSTSVGSATVTGGPVIEFGAWHGDWADWNLAVSGDHVLVWDWELFGDDVPLGFDAVHRKVQNGVIFGGLSPQQSFAQALEHSPELLAPFAVTPAHAGLVTLLYTVEIATRYLEVAEHSTLLADLDGWLAPVITRLLGLFEARDSPTRA